MSLINEALKKIQNQKNSPEHPQEEKRESLLFQEERGKSKRFLILLTVITLLLAGGILIVVFLTSTPRPQGVKAQRNIAAFQFSEMQQEGSTEDADSRSMAAMQTNAIEEQKVPAEKEATKESFDASVMKAAKEMVQQKSMHAGEKMPTEDKDINEEMLQKFVSSAVDTFVKKEPKEEKPAKEEGLIKPLRDAQARLDKLSKENKALKEKAATTKPSDPNQAYIDKLNITGVMFSGDKSKVLMDSRVLSINSVIKEDPKITLIEIQPHTLIFADESGRRYEKAF